MMMNEEKASFPSACMIVMEKTIKIIQVARLTSGSHHYFESPRINVI